MREKILWSIGAILDTSGVSAAKVTFEDLPLVWAYLDGSKGTGMDTRHTGDAFGAINDRHLSVGVDVESIHWTSLHAGRRICAMMTDYRRKVIGVPLGEGYFQPCPVGIASGIMLQ